MLLWPVIVDLSIHCTPFLLHCVFVHQHPRSFPTRRSSDLSLRHGRDTRHAQVSHRPVLHGLPLPQEEAGGDRSALLARLHLDRKSTRLNSSHLVISYAVFCLKKKNAIIDNQTTITPQTNRT